MAQSSGVLVGVITTPSGEPVRNALIVLVSSTGDIRRETTTDSLGIYAFSLLPAAEYVLETPAHIPLSRGAGQMLLRDGEKRSWRIVWDEPTK